MSTTFNGHAEIYGIGINCTVAIGGYAAVFMDSAPIVHRAKVDEHVGVNGRFCSIVHSQEYLELAISFRPAASASQADLVESLVFLPKGSTVVLSGFRVIAIGTIPDILNQSWLLVGDTTLTLNASDPMTVDLTLRHYLDDQTKMLAQVPVTPPG